MKQLMMFTFVFFLLNAVALAPTEGVQILDASLQQKWGYVTVYTNVSLFWWLHEQNPPTKPLLIWLGFHSTAETNFNKYGPISSDLEWRNYSLTHDYNILFIDSMAGAGFSYTTKRKLLPKITHETSYDLLMCIKSFFNQYPKFKTSPVYIVADAFFAKIAPEVAHLWTVVGPREDVPYNLKGLIIGIDPYFIHQEEIWQYYKSLKTNLINANLEKRDMVEEIQYLINNEFWLNALLKMNSLSHDYFPQASNYLKQLITSTTEFIKTATAITKKSKMNKLMNHQVRQKLSLRSAWKINRFRQFIYNVKNQSLRPIFQKQYEILLNSTSLKIVFFNTPMDLKVHKNPNFLAWTNQLNWHGKDVWKIQNELQFTFKDKIEGFKKNYNNLYQYSITQNSNLDLAINAEFLRFVFAEVMN